MSIQITRVFQGMSWRIAACALAVLAHGAPSWGQEPAPSQAQTPGQHQPQSLSLDSQLQRIIDDPQAHDRPRYIFIGAALNTREPVFDADVHLAHGVLSERLGTAYRAVLLSNTDSPPAQGAWPLASVENLHRAITTLAEHRRAGDRYIVLLTTHGGPGILEVHQPRIYPGAVYLQSDQLAVWVNTLAPQPTWLVLSACYAGSHLPVLAEQGQRALLTMAAASADRPSFGCDPQGDYTWFTAAFVEALSTQSSVQEVWDTTKRLVSQRERSMKMRPSRPQWQVGADWKGWLSKPWVQMGGNR